MKRTALLLLAGLLAVAVPAFAAKERADAAPQTQWTVWGGEAAFRWNEDLLRLLGVELIGIEASKADDYGYRRLAVRDQSALRFAVNQGSFGGFTGGGLALQGGFELRSKHGTVSLRSLRFAPRAGDPFVLDVVGDDGTAWFFVDRLMYDIERGKTPVLDIRTMDMRIGQAFADRLGDATMLGHSVADVALRARIHADDGDYSALVAKGATSKWPGELAPDNSTYQADVFMQSFSTVWKRQSGVDGPGGANGSIVYAPSSTLRNNRSNGTPVQTIVDPMGTSAAPWAANVAWYEKFTGNFPPYGNDQHPYLIWNLYRTDALDRLVQVARSGVKHAFLTINTNCDEHPGSGHILGRGCADTYSDGNNDSIGDLGPRSEIIPATAQWGRCGSVYDKDCDETRDSGSPCSNVGGPTCSAWAFRMAVSEADIQATTNNGATYRMESWYIVRDDIDIYNTMQTRQVGFTWNAGNGMWQVANSGALQLGPAIDRWVPRDSMGPLQSSATIANGDGQARVAVKVADLGAGQYRYTYAVMNFDFAKAVTSGAEPNLRVLSNDGFTALSVPRASAVSIGNPVSFDGDGADWTLDEDLSAFTWTAAVGNPLNWGSLYTFSFVANAAPVAGTVGLATANVGSPEVIDVAALVPGDGGGFAVGGTITGVAGSDGVDLQLNAETPITRSADGFYLFPTALADGTPYSVAIVREPTGRSCSIGNAQGTVTGASVGNVDIACALLPPDFVPVSGTLQGMAAGRSVSLALNGGAPIALSGNGTFVFPTEAAVGTNYSVQVTTQPVAQLCTLTNGSGSVPAGGVDNLVVTCVNRQVTLHAVQVELTGLDSGRDILLQLNGINNLRLVQDGEYVFGTRLESGSDYAVTIFRQPQGQSCVVTNGSGIVDAADVSGPLVTCTDLPPTYAIGGTVTGLGAGQSVTLALNGGETLLRSSDGAFQFVQTLADNAPYAVTIVSSVGVECEVAGGSGTVQGAPMSSVGVACLVPWSGFRDGFE